MIAPQLITLASLSPRKLKPASKRMAKPISSAALHYDGRKRVWENDSKNEVGVAGTARASSSYVLEFPNLQKLCPRDARHTSPTDDTDGKGDHGE